jgi:Animal haem peroxidase
MRPYQTSRPNTYCRLFPPDPNGPGVATSGRLFRLAGAMACDDPSIPLDDVVPSEFIPAAYTYFGQFIDHDMTYDQSGVPNPGSQVDPGQTTNFRKSFLNLDNVYGDGPQSAVSASLYEDDKIFFRLGAALSNGRSFDVPLRMKCTPENNDLCAPETADPRNVENAIVRQIHAMFLQLHNLAAEELLKSYPSYSSAKVFAEARDRVRHQFQWLVWKDFIPKICNASVLKEAYRSRSRLIDWNGHAFSIPVEFAQAAFRYGHSMVRSSYFLGTGQLTNLNAIFGGSASRGALPTRLAVNWDNFCGLTPCSEYARPIGTTIVMDLYQVPPSSIQVFLATMAARVRSGSDQILPLRTLHRGAAVRLASGQGAVEYLLEKPVTSVTAQPSPDYVSGRSPWDRLDACDLSKEIPLWYFILMEAELNEVGNRLGCVGSTIVAGTIAEALWSNPKSFLHLGHDWEPPPWTAWNGSQIQIRKLHDVARVVGLA